MEWEGRGHAANIRGVRKTVQTVFTYLSRSLLVEKGRGGDKFIADVVDTGD
jgi:hypothetical protein